MSAMFFLQPEGLYVGVPRPDFIMLDLYLAKSGLEVLLNNNFQVEHGRGKKKSLS
ncbi:MULTISPECIES: hypothetical protein [unclassified Microcoleus]|uniref:hypothetical protein n=1 Tax=unclassified Microcoleus TaxID=2642155 RepID=UPI002FD6EA3A